MSFIGSILAGIYDAYIFKKREHKGKKDGWISLIITPSIKLSIITFTLLIFCFLGYKLIFKDSLKKKKTVKEIAAISKTLFKIKSNTGLFPKSLDILIGQNPTRKKWKLDAWNNEYFYEVSKDQKKFIITSCGKDKILNTQDDIRFESTDLIQKTN